MAMISLKTLLSEIENTTIDFGYHYTSKENYDKIQKEGLRINQRENLTNKFGNESDNWVKRAYGLTPIFLSLKPLKQFGPRMPMGSNYDWVLLKVDVRGLDIAADLGFLIDHGAYIEEDGFWFERKPKWLDDYEYSYEDLQGSDTFDLNSVIKNTGTFVVLENIDVNRINKVGEHNKFSLGGIMNYLTQK